MNLSQLYKTVPAGANSPELWYIYCTMTKKSGLPTAKTVVLFTMLTVLALVPTAAQDGHLQPSLHLVFPEGAATPAGDDGEVQQSVVAAVEARIASQRRYQLSRRFTSADPETFVSREDTAGYDVVVFVGFASRLDGSLRAEYDIFHDGGFLRSGERQLSPGETLFPDADAFAEEVTLAVEELFSGFGRLRFSNTGYPHNFYVYANGVFLGANLREIDLPAGSYNVEIRRRDGGFSQVAGRRQVQLGNDDFYEISFAMSRAAPPVPGFMRLTNPGERWRGIFTLRGTGLIPLEGFDELANDGAAAAAATVLFGHIPFRSAVLGFEAEHLWYSGRSEGDEFLGEPDLKITVSGTTLMGVLGLTVGPVSGVDFVARAGGGVMLYQVDEKADLYETRVYEDRYERVDPAFNGTVEFGFGLGRHGRLSLQTALLGVVRDGDIYSWLQLGVGLGGRF
jgi:hypothetical protein